MAQYRFGLTEFHPYNEKSFARIVQLILIDVILNQGCPIIDSWVRDKTANLNQPYIKVTSKVINLLTMLDRKSVV